MVEPRYEELFTLIQAELRRSGFEDLVAAGIVLTGGTSRMEGAVELAEEIFHMPVRLARPQGVRGMEDLLSNPIYATGIGLLLFARADQGPSSSELVRQEEALGRSVPSGPGVVQRIKAWLQGNF